MLCPACKADNPAAARRCAACGGKLPRRPRAAADDEVLYPSWSHPPDRAALIAYRCSAIGLVPFVGLLLGPVGLALGAVAWARGRNDPSFRGLGPATAAVVLGGLSLVTNWVGLVLMVIGLRSG